MNRQLESALRAYADEQGPTAADRSRNWDALEARVAAGELGPELDADSPVDFEFDGIDTELGTEVARAADAGGRAASIAKPLLWVTLGLGALGALAWPRDDVSTASDVLESRTTERDEADSESRPSEASPLEARPDEAVPSSVLAEGEPATASRGASTTLVAKERDTSAAKPRRSSTATPENATSVETAAPSKRGSGRPATDVEAAAEAVPSGLGPEMELMSRARTAVGRGDARGALELLAAHERRFPDGAFVREREMSRVTAYCILGRVDKAREAAARFMATKPGAVWAARVAETCASDTTK